MSVLRKECPRPGCEIIYNEDEEGFKSEFCKCGAPLLEKKVATIKEITISRDAIIPQDNPVIEIEIEIETETETKEIYNNEDLECTNAILVKEYQMEVEPENSSIFTVDSLGYIHFVEPIEVEQLNEDKIVIYVSGQIYKEVPIEYDETIVGRHNVNFDPDIDLSEIDPDGYTSRRHVMIYKENDRFYARNLSTKNSVHIERDVLANGESKELNDNDLIILSKYIVMVFKKKI